MLTTILPANLQQAFLAALDTCGDMDLAAVCAESTPDEIRRTMRRDAEFAKKVAAARSKWVQGHVENVSRAGRTDWRASMALLERLPETRQKFAPPTVKTEATIALQVSGMSDAELIAQLGLDATPRVVDTEGEEVTDGAEAQE